MENQFERDTESAFKPWLGKRVRVTDQTGKEWVGELNFAGVNDLHGKFQVTINRTPIWPVDRNKVKLEK